MELFYVVVIIMLIVIFANLLTKQKRKTQELKLLMEQTQRETAAAIAVQQEVFVKEKNSMLPKEQVVYAVKKLHSEKEVKFKELRDEFTKKISEYEEKVNKLSSYVQSLERQSRNFGEINTHKILSNLKNELVTQSIIDFSQMMIIPNIFVPLEDKDGEVSSRQIDHLVLTTKGIFIIETKYWKGTIFYGLTKEKAKDFSFILDSLYPNIKNDVEKTVVFVNSIVETDEGSSNKKEIRIVSYDDPASQVRKTAWHLNKLLKEHGENIFITPIIFFGYKDKVFMNFSKNDNPYVFDSRESLCNFFIEHLSDSNREYTVEQLNKIKRIVENANYLT